jgi:hypothetical protein
MFHGHDGPVLFLGLFFCAMGIWMWAYDKVDRIQAVTVALGAALFVISIPEWLDALAAASARGAGLSWLAILFTGSLISCVFEIGFKHKHHPVRTPIIGIIFGTTLPLAYANGKRLLSWFAKAISDSPTDLQQARHQVQDGHAAHALSAGSGHQVLLMAVAALVAIFFVALSVHRRRGKKPAAAREIAAPATPKALTGRPGTPIAPASAARRPLPAGRRK